MIFPVYAELLESVESVGRGRALEWRAEEASRITLAQKRSFFLSLIGRADLCDSALAYSVAFWINRKKGEEKVKKLRLEEEARSMCICRHAVIRHSQLRRRQPFSLSLSDDIFFPLLFYWRHAAAAAASARGATIWRPSAGYSSVHVANWERGERGLGRRSNCRTGWLLTSD